MQTVAPPQISMHIITAFFAAMRVWLLEVMAPFLLHVADRSSNGRAIRAWLDADVRSALDDTKKMLLAMAVARMPARRVRAYARGGARPGTHPPGFRPRVAPSRRWLRLTTRAFKARRPGLRGRLELLRDLIARPARAIARILLCLNRIGRSRKGARFICVAPPATACVCAVRAPAPACADTS